MPLRGHGAGMAWCHGLPSLAGPLAPGKSVAIPNSPGPVLACAFHITFAGFTGRTVYFSQTGYFCPDVVFLCEPLCKPPRGETAL